jgi:hypothetical protein
MSFKHQLCQFFWIVFSAECHPTPILKTLIAQLLSPLFQFSWFCNLSRSMITAVITHFFFCRLGIDERKNLVKNIFEILAISTWDNLSYGTSAIFLAPCLPKYNLSKSSQMFVDTLYTAVYLCNTYYLILSTRGCSLLAVLWYYWWIRISTGTI